MFVPLFFFDRWAVRARILRVAPLWGALQIEGKAKYLGFIVGPDRGEDSWTSPSVKFLDRAKVWRSIGLGMLHTMEAYQVFISSVLSFIAQLDELPPSFSVLEKNAALSCSLVPEAGYRRRC